jgi:hypothetical protein
VVVLDYALSGMDPKVIAAETGYSLNSVYRILNHPNTIQLRQQKLEAFQRDFDNLYNKVTERIREGLDNLDPKIVAIYTNQWLKANGKLSEKQKGLTVNLTAEDVIMQIKNGTYEEQGRD